MPTTDKFTPSRKIRTYGKQVRNHGFGVLGRAAGDTDRHPGKTNDVLLSKKEEAPEAGKKDTRGTGALTPVGKAVSRTPKAKEEVDIFDVQLSDEDRQTRAQPWLKRRKLNTPKAGWRSEGVEKVVPKSTPPQNQAVSDAVGGRDGKDATSLVRDGKKDTEMEVAVRSPIKARRNSNARSSKQVADRPPSRPMTQSGVNTLLNGRPTAADLRELPVRERSLRTPQKGVPQLMKSFSTGTDRMRHVDGRFNIGSAGRGQKHNGLPNRITSTAERKRLVDALGSREKTDSPSDSSGDEAPSRDRNSRASSHAPTPSIDQRTSADTMATESVGGTHPRRQKQINLHQATPSGLKVTYSRQRSFLNEMDTIEEVGGNSAAPGFPPPPASMTSKLGGDTSFPPLGLSSQISGLPAGLEEETASGSSTIRSIHELRRSGDNARYHAIIETIFEDIEDKTAPISRKRSGMVQLCTKLFDPQFSQRFLSNALEKRFAKINPGEFDLVCGYLTSCIYALLLSSGSISPMTLHYCWMQILRVAPFLLGEDKSMIEITKRRELKMTKAGKADIQDICEKITESKIWTSQIPSTVTPQLLTLRCLELAIRKLRETGNAMETMSVPVLRQVIDILLKHSLVDDIDKAGPDELLMLELTLSILESYTIHTLSLEEEQQEALKPLSKLGLLLSNLGRQPDARSRQIQILEIRLILNITNNNPTLCEEFSTPEFIEALAQIVLSSFQSVGDEFTGSQKESLLDTVILALGALINLAEWSSASRQVLLESEVASTTLIDRLLPLFVDGLEAIAEADSVVQTHSNVAFGYLSVLLCTACLDDDARSYLRTKLQARTFERLLGTVEEFLHYHRKVEDELHDARGDGEDAMSGFTSRLQGIVDRIRDAERP
ncbi:uncharacterized protein GIQ15_06557 [Arthroderma uncinatum]|uniref:uncharacterized protein n=1 Tax=Arthroderma uncinatum TaxID=74035 RepID=UPI00144A5B24|nr:uncharacterized protein GIQ15_06557 [Arthroderma uncinatum]KAF3479581.1 hypothetical protein GIQ15_06557 [Arthroderma uncinatum]